MHKKRLQNVHLHKFERKMNEIFDITAAVTYNLVR